MKKLDTLYLLNPDSNPENLTSNVTYNPSKDIAELFTPEELEIVEEVWNSPNGPSANGWKRGLVGWLLETTNGLSYGKNDYAKFLASAKYKQRFSNAVQNTLTAAVGCAVLSADGYYLIQQRAEGLLAGKRLDSSAAGMGVIRDGKLDFYFEMKEKLKRELNLSEETFCSTLLPTGIHGATDHLSMQVTWKCEVTMPLEELISKANPKFVERIHSVQKDDLPSYLIEHYVLPEDKPENSLIGDAVGVFLRALDKNARDYAVNRMNSNGADIRLGILHDCKFEEQ